MPPVTTICDAGEAAKEKSGGGGELTIRLTLAVWFKLPLVPVMVSV